MPSETDVGKRALVEIVKELAAKYRVPLTLTRDSSNQDVKKAFRKVARSAKGPSKVCHRKPNHNNFTEHKSEREHPNIPHQRDNSSSEIKKREQMPPEEDSSNY